MTTFHRAEQRAQRRDAEVDFRLPSSAVERKTTRPAGAVSRRLSMPAMIFQARDGPFVDPLGQVHHFLEQAVEAVGAWD